MTLEVLDAPVRDATVEGSMLFLEPPADGKPVVEFSYGRGGSVGSIIRTWRWTKRC